MHIHYTKSDLRLPVRLLDSAGEIIPLEDVDELKIKLYTIDEDQAILRDKSDIDEDMTLNLDSSVLDVMPDGILYVKYLVNWDNSHFSDQTYDYVSRVQTSIYILNAIQHPGYDPAVIDDDYLAELIRDLQNGLAEKRDIVDSYSQSEIDAKDASVAGAIPTSLEQLENDGEDPYARISDLIPGAQGPQGAVGPQGPQGAAGRDGVDGARGPQGARGETGAQGPQGARGETGATGARGPQGFQGAQGPQGPQGAQGAAGEKGEQGEKGDTGEQGPQGPQGAQGPQGEQGAQGPRGFQGAQGAQGEQGPQGAQGAQGLQGPRGFQGYTGAQGAQGEQGPQGAQGAQGPQGEKGDAGVQGAQGATGQRGPQGEKGEKGDRGPQGYQGPQGPQGAKGSKGDKGDTGEKGDRGPQGAQGAQGPQGAQGNPGVQGATGPQGPQGAQGNPGVQGPVGPQGPRGYDGEAGPRGYQGETGAQGSPGVQGPVGPQGAQGEQGPQGVQGPVGPQGPRGEGAGIPDAPVDGSTYARKDGDWIPIESAVDAYTKDEVDSMMADSSTFTKGHYYTKDETYTKNALYTKTQADEKFQGKLVAGEHIDIDASTNTISADLSDYYNKTEIDIKFEGIKTYVDEHTGEIIIIGEGTFVLGNVVLGAYATVGARNRMTITIEDNDGHTYTTSPDENGGFGPYNIAKNNTYHLSVGNLDPGYTSQYDSETHTAGNYELKRYTVILLGPEPVEPEPDPTGKIDSSTFNLPDGYSIIEVDGDVFDADEWNGDPIRAIGVGYSGGGYSYVIYKNFRHSVLLCANNTDNWSSRNGARLLGTGEYTSNELTRRNFEDVIPSAFSYCEGALYSGTCYVNGRQCSTPNQLTLTHILRHMETFNTYLSKIGGSLLGETIRYATSRMYFGARTNVGRRYHYWYETTETIGDFTTRWAQADYAAATIIPVCTVNN